MNTKIIKTPKMKVEVELKEWISGKEGEEIDAPMTDIKFKINQLGQGATELNVGEAMRKSVEIAVNIVVLKIDGETRDIWKRVQEMPKVDYKFILKEVDKVVSGKDFTKPFVKQKDGID